MPTFTIFTIFTIFRIPAGDKVAGICSKVRIRETKSSGFKRAIGKDNGPTTT